MSLSSVGVKYGGKSWVTKVSLAVLGAAFYGTALWATRFLPVIPGVTWLRPANILSEILSLALGPLGAVAVMFGNSFGDFMAGGFNPTNLWWLWPVELIGTGLVCYWGVTDPSLRSLGGKIQWFVMVVLVQGFVTGFGIAYFLFVTGVVKDPAMIRVIGPTIFMNEAMPAIAAGFVWYALFPQLVKRGLWWGRNLDRSDVPPEYLKELRG